MELSMHCTLVLNGILLGFPKTELERQNGTKSVYLNKHLHYSFLVLVFSGALLFIDEQPNSAIVAVCLLNCLGLILTLFNRLLPKTL